ncbi:helix-turn-helix transcriptional regulator [Weissella koreensis]|uniref:WYL domain-containing protein n=1 Tax=Weissella koreensis TaxID=165096 RepID=A0A7H1MKZ4_9LACO|nr:WYL domain-containing protein [Weissella koreensis]AVH74927.1 hypothetical protein C4597_02360 [Weissella koreensis]QGN20151.1 WYL domain-containing protein [Weissella koreensis]QNT64130.1 WYL domain-containing protein [Weissella koreensis]
MSKNKINRPLQLMLQLIMGNTIKQADWQDQNQISTRSVQRDVSDINEAISTINFPAELKTIKLDNHVAYQLSTSNQLDPKIIITLIKTILATRAFNDEEIHLIIDSLLDQADLNIQQVVSKTIKNELSLYSPVTHQKSLLDLIWLFSQWIKDQTTIKFSYKNSKNEVRHLSGLPTGLIFDTYYFYAIIHFHATEHHPARDAQYRLDRFKNTTPIQEHIDFPHRQRLEEGKIRQNNNLMQIGSLIHVEFEYYGNPEVVLDKFPMSKIKLGGATNKFKIHEINKNGFKMWALSQGKNIKITYPQSLVKEIIEDTSAILNLYK